MSNETLRTAAEVNPTTRSIKTGVRIVYGVLGVVAVATVSLIAIQSK